MSKISQLEQEIKDLKEGKNNDVLTQEQKDDIQRTIDTLEGRLSKMKEVEKGAGKKEAGAKKSGGKKRGPKPGSKNKPETKKKDKPAKKSYKVAAEKKEDKAKKTKEKYVTKRAKKKAAEKTRKKYTKKRAEKKTPPKPAKKKFERKQYKKRAAVTIATKESVIKQINEISGDVEHKLHSLIPAINKLADHERKEAENHLRTKLHKHIQKFEAGGHVGKPSFLDRIFGRNKKEDGGEVDTMAKGGGVGPGGIKKHPHVKLKKGVRLVHGTEATKSANKNDKFAAPGVKLDAGHRLDKGYETVKGTKKDHQYTDGGHIEAYDVREKKKVKMLNATITKTGNRYMAKGTSESGHKLAKVMDEATAKKAVEAGHAKKGW
jgi:hypothetical protein